MKNVPAKVPFYTFFSIKNKVGDKKHFGSFPINEDIMNDKYFNDNGDCVEEDNFYPMTAFDKSGVVGHFIMRYLHGDNHVLRFGIMVS